MKVHMKWQAGRRSAGAPAAVLAPALAPVPAGRTDLAGPNPFLLPVSFGFSKAGLSKEAGGLTKRG